MTGSGTALGRRIRALREGKRLTQEQLAERAELSLKHLGQIERGRGNPTLSSLEALAQALGVSLSELFELEHERMDASLLKERIDRIVEAADTPKRRIIYGLLRVLIS